MRCGNWKTSEEMSVGQAGFEVADVLVEGVLAEDVLAEALVAARVVSGVELLAEAEGLPSAVQLKPPVLKVIASQPVVFVNALLKML